MSVISKFPHAGQRTTIEPWVVIKSPAFRVAYPTVRNLELVIDGVRQAMEESWARGCFEARDVEIFRIQGAYFVEECLIFDDQLRVISNASDHYSDEEVDTALRSIVTLLEEQKLPHLVGPGVVAKRRAVNNFGHFLMEMLPMAVIGRAACQGKEPEFLVHRVQPELMDVMLRAFRLLEVKPSRLHFPDYREPMRFEELVVVRGLTSHGTYMSPLCVTAVASLAGKVTAGQHKKLFVTRRPGWQRGRRLLNETELSRRLQTVGFHVIEPSELTLEEQIAAFSGAEDVVAVAGAALTNTVFCRPGTRVVNLASAHFPDTFFWFVATHKGLQYSEVRGDPKSGQAFDTTSDFRIRESDIEWLENLHRPADSPAMLGGKIVAHVQGIGDTSVEFGAWAGLPGSGRWIEGFSMSAPESGGIKYRAVLEKDWLSPWIDDGAFCGSRGVELPVRGLCVQLTAPLAQAYECLCNATFVDGWRAESVPAGEVCQADNLAPLEAFQVVFRPRS